MPSHIKSPTIYMKNEVSFWLSFYPKTSNYNCTLPKKNVAIRINTGLSARDFQRAFYLSALVSLQLEAQFGLENTCWQQTRQPYKVKLFGVIHHDKICNLVPESLFIKVGTFDVDH